MIRTLLGDPESLRAAAARLDAGAAFIDESARQTGRAAESVLGGWSGSAEVAFAARTLQLTRSIGELTGQLTAVAAATRGYAGQVQTARDELARLARLTTDCEDLGAAGMLAAQAEEVHLQNAHAARALAVVLEGTDPARAIPPVVAELAAGAVAAKSAAAGWSAVSVAWGAGRYWSDGAALARSASSLSTAGLATVASDTVSGLSGMAGMAGASEVSGVSAGVAASDAAMAARMAESVSAARLSSLPSAAKLLPMGVLRVAGPLATVAEGAWDVVAGDDEHGGWRDVGTRVMGGVGALGGAGLLIATGPVGTGVAVTAVAAYGLWKAGTAVYDNWPALRRGAEQGGALLGRAGRAVAERASIAVSSAVSGAGETVQRVVGGWLASLPMPPSAPGVGAGVL